VRTQASPPRVASSQFVGRIAPYVVSAVAAPAAFMSGGVAAVPSPTALPQRYERSVSDTGVRLDERLSGILSNLITVVATLSDPETDVILAPNPRNVRHIRGKIVRRDWKLKAGQYPGDFDHLD
jgi:hypothetical protein